MRKRIVLCLLSSLMMFTFVGCGTNMYESQESQVSEYNNGVDDAKKLFKENEELAKSKETEVMNMVTCNEISKETYKLLNIEKPLDREEGEKDNRYMWRNMHTLMKNTSVDTYNEYVDWINGVSTYTNSMGDHVFLYGQPYIIKRGYYSSVSSNYLTQFMVLRFQDSTESVKVRVYWKDKKIQGIVLQ